MSGDVDFDLSGQWSGLYNYPIPAPPTSFEAVIRDTGGLITGETSEAGDTPDCAGQLLHALIEGRREGARVHFVKVYDHLGRAANPITYDGQVLSGGDEIEGRWTIPGIWSGTFMMVRARKEETAAQRKVSEEIR